MFFEGFLYNSTGDDEYGLKAKSSSPITWPKENWRIARISRIIEGRGGILCLNVHTDS